MLLVIKIMVPVDTNKLDVNITMLHFDIIYLACRGRSMPPHKKKIVVVSWLFYNNETR